MRRSMLSLLLALGLVLAACASDPEAGGTTTTPGVETTAANGEEPTNGEEPDEGEEPEGGDAEAGAEAFAGTCATCHGPDAKGITGLGKDLTTSQFVTDSTDAEFIAFLEVGRPADDPLNTTGVAMPPKGGNPALTSEDLADVVAYVRSIHEG